MLDPISAVSAATVAFNTVKKFVHAGQEFENVAGQLGKWYTHVSDFRKGQQLQKKPPLFKKLFAGGSIEEEALALIVHEKKLQEQEKELEMLLNVRFGFGTWKEMLEMRRKIRKEREEQFYKQKERQQAVIEAISVTVGIAAIIGVFSGIIYFAISMS